MFDNFFTTKPKKKPRPVKKNLPAGRQGKKASSQSLPAGRHGLEWSADPELTIRVRTLVDSIEFVHISKERIFCFRTDGSKSRAYARIWAFPKIFQTVLEIEPAYVIEVINKYYNKLDSKEQTKVLIHELLHIPRNFSGSLLPHTYGNKRIDHEVERLYKQLKKL